ncbi:MAG TPA: DUF1080 domain-containing protein [Pirellulaceae bacterium]|nr:DUF1080 domain-containing protein [Pirellulaceae bacterium]
MLPILLFLLAADLQPLPFTSPSSAVPEYGHALTVDESLDGWIALFDGKTTFGWSEAAVEEETLALGQSTSPFGSCETKGEATSAGQMTIGDQMVKLEAGPFRRLVNVGTAGPIKLGEGLALKSLAIKPGGLKDVFNRRDLTGWTILKHPRLPDDRQAKWTIEEGALHAVGGPGAAELDGKYGDLVLKVEARMRKKLVNGGVFFRSIPGDFMNGYEAQLFNGCYENDPAKPARYSTGAIDDRQLARRLVSRDLEPLVMTIIAAGPHIATWVNGYQMTDWTDTRDKHDNPRDGLRLEPGTIQLQAHDPETDIEFRRVAVGEIK